MRQGTVIPLPICATPLHDNRLPLVFGGRLSTPSDHQQVEGANRSAGHGNVIFFRVAVDSQGIVHILGDFFGKLWLSQDNENLNILLV